MIEMSSDKMLEEAQAQAGPGNRFARAARKSYRTKALSVFLAAAGLLFALHAKASADCNEVFFSTCVGDFADGGDEEAAARLLGNVNNHSLGILEGNKLSIFIASGSRVGYDWSQSTPSRAGYVGIWYNGLNQFPAYHLDVNGEFRSTNSAHLATNWGGVDIGTITAFDTKLHVYRAPASTGSLIVASTGGVKVFEVTGTSVTVGTKLVFPDGTIMLSAGGASLWSTSGNDITNSNSGNVGVATAAPLSRLHVSSGSGSGGSILRVSTGGTTVFDVSGASVVVGTKLVFPDGSVQVTAAGASAWTINGNDTYETGTGDVLVGTQTAGTKLRVTQVAGTTKPGLLVSTGTTKLLEVAGASITAGVPIYYPDGSQQYRGQIRSMLYISSVVNYGTVDTKVLFLSSSNSNGPVISSGTDITFTSGTVAAGSTITFNTSGLYNISYQISHNAAIWFGLVINNGVQPTTNWQSMTAGTKFCGGLGTQEAANDFTDAFSCTLFIAAGTNMRFQGQGANLNGLSTAAGNFISIVKVGD